MKTFQRSWSKN